MFKKEFKYFKSRCPHPSLENVVDLKSKNSASHRQVLVKEAKLSIEHNECTKYGLFPVNQWEIFEFTNKPGLLFIVNPFTAEGQQYWVKRCLKDYTRKPNRLNLDPFNELSPEEDWWDATQKKTERAEKLLQKLRWATLGYHHNWDTKEYSEASHDEFPSDLAELSRLIVLALDLPGCSNYQAEAAIINFYHLDSTLSGHKDQSEPYGEAPLLSVSFGQSAIFLVGGETLDEPVTSMILSSGDILVMSGQARRCYHGVPRIIPTSDKPWAVGSWDTTCFGHYLETNRINMNVRQVLPPGDKSLIKR